MIRLEVKGTKMSLVVHDSCKDNPTCESNVETHTGLSSECEGVNMLAISVKVKKLGFAIPDLNLPAWVTLFTGDFPTGVHFQSLPLALSKLLPSTHEYALTLRVGLSASATMNPDTGYWSMEKEDVHVCSPGFELAGELTHGRIMTFLANQFKSVVSDNLPIPIYCLVKYDLPSYPWIGQLLTFIGKDQLRKENSRSTRPAPHDQQQAPSHFQVEFDNKLTPAYVKQYDHLHFHTGWQLNVPTLHFIGHFLDTSIDVAEHIKRTEEKEKAELAAEEVEHLSHGPMTKKDTLLLQKLDAMGFDRAVFLAVKEIEAYIEQLTKDTAAVSSWLAGVTENIWNVLFTGGNELEIFNKGGFSIGKDAAGQNGGISGKIDKLKISSATQKTPLNIDLFFMDKIDLLAGVLAADVGELRSLTRTDSSILHEPPVNDGVVKTPLNGLQMLRKQSNHPNAAQLLSVEDIPDDHLFYMKGKTTLIELNNGELSGTIETLLRNKDKMNEVVQDELAKQIIQVLLKLIIKHDVRFDIKTENNQPGAHIDHMSVNARRLEVGGSIEYGGPVCVTSTLKAITNILNTVTIKHEKDVQLKAAIQKKKYKQWLADNEGERGKCLFRAYHKYQLDKETAEKDALESRDKCEDGVNQVVL